MRIGIGYDAHRFQLGRPLILGGIVIPYEYGLSGHSDADVLIHSMIDALLGAANLGDIGKRFPDTDQRYKGIDSKLLLKMADQMIQQVGFSIMNIDSVIIAEEPKLKDYISSMSEKIASVLMIDKELISIKATTTEGMGFEGKKEGISAQSVCLLEKK
ncbi:MAG TPA: 2-C-methyl-D-erythritol 2,4-cyclodiphosphate synthase [Thermotogota bacterium]|nr:2-C-methyl-D-erythritol 2,4-cyclodiphosphate synthase [Thermotogota bacterium]HRW33743.1 2-C-methyl-D-erythritol 2,4-cyclodiphosphate synthase [Thermotogota bacterium]